MWSLFTLLSMHIVLESFSLPPIRPCPTQCRSEDYEERFEKWKWLLFTRWRNCRNEIRMYWRLQNQRQVGSGMNSIWKLCRVWCTLRSDKVNIYYYGISQSCQAQIQFKLTKVWLLPPSLTQQRNLQLEIYGLWLVKSLGRSDGG